jgi:hypothetical protein
MLSTRHNSYSPSYTSLCFAHQPCLPSCLHPLPTSLFSAGLNHTAPNTHPHCSCTCFGTCIHRWCIRIGSQVSRRCLTHDCLTSCSAQHLCGQVAKATMAMTRDQGPGRSKRRHSPQSVNQSINQAMYLSQPPSMNPNDSGHIRHLPSVPSIYLRSTLDTCDNIRPPHRLPKWTSSGHPTNQGTGRPASKASLHLIKCFDSGIQHSCQRSYFRVRSILVLSPSERVSTSFGPNSRELIHPSRTKQTCQ